MGLDEKRKFTRIPFETQITLTAGEKVITADRLRDISLGGVFIFCAETLPEHTPCELDINLVGPASLLRIHVEGEVVRQGDTGLAIEFTRIDLDGLVHLRHFIKVHSMDPQTIDREYAANLLSINRVP